MHVCYNSWYISLPSSANQQHEMTKFRIIWRTRTMAANFLNFYVKFNPAFHIQFRDGCDHDKQTMTLEYCVIHG